MQAGEHGRMLGSSLSVDYPVEVEWTRPTLEAISTASARTLGRRQASAPRAPRRR
jgi:hypothetical protein